MNALNKQILVLFIIPFLFSPGVSQAFGQTPGDPPLPKKEDSSQKSGTYSTIEFNSLSKRDPFRNLSKRKDKMIEPPGRESRPPGIGGVLIAEVRLIGIAAGTKGENLAVLSGPDKKAHFAYVGDRLFDGYIKQITSERVKFVKEVKYSSGEGKKREVLLQLYPSAQ